MAALFFWGFVTITSLSIVWATHLSKRETERTIRMAIEQGVPLDADTIRRLKSGSNKLTPIYLAISGIVLLSISLALVAFGLIIAPEEPDTLLPLLAIATFLAIPALTISVCGYWLLRRKTEQHFSD